MKTYKKVYEKICSTENLHLAFRKAKKGKTKKFYVIEFEQNLEKNLILLQRELLFLTYKPKPLKCFIIRDPKTRKIHASKFIDRIVHHAIVNILEPLFEKVFIYDSFASRKSKGTHSAINRFEEFMKKVSRNGRLVKNATNDNQIQGYCLKADIKSYFDNVDRQLLMEIIRKKIDDEKVIWLIRQVLDNFRYRIKGKGMTLGNFTSQFFANVYLNELDYFVKHKLKVRYYIRYVDDFVILHRNKKRLSYYKREIDTFLVHNLKIGLHPDKSKIIALRNGITFLGYRIFYHYRLLIKRNVRLIKKKIFLFKNKEISQEKFKDCLKGWEGYAKWANSYKLRRKLLRKINNSISLPLSLKSN
jgi:retron-type reverse transcriptase